MIELHSNRPVSWITVAASFKFFVWFKPKSFDNASYLGQQYFFVLKGLQNAEKRNFSKHIKIKVASFQSLPVCSIRHFLSFWLSFTNHKLPSHLMEVWRLSIAL